MPRTFRQKHDEAIYHIMTRGNNRENIFLDDDDKNRYLGTLKRYKERYKIKIYSYCLMDNHVHLIIDCCGQDISKIMQGISLSYTQYFNRKYQRCGHLHQDRFKSVIVENDFQLIQLTKYIHLNPAKANLIQRAEEYKWSSLRIYYGEKDVFSIVDKQFVLEYFSKFNKTAVEKYMEFVQSNLDNIKAKIDEKYYANTDRRIQGTLYSINEILTRISQYYSICIDEITKKSNRRHMKIRNMAAYIISLKCKLSCREIAKKFDICPSGIGHAIKNAVSSIASDPNINQKYITLMEMFV